MVGKQISVPLRSFHVIKKLRTLCAETVARVYPVEVTAAVQVPHGQPGLPATDHLRTQLSSTSAPPSPAPRRKRDYLNRERVVGVQTWMSSFLPLASEMVDKPLRFASVRDRLRLHGSVPLLRGFSERATSVPVKTDVAAQTEELPVPSATPEASYRLGWILKEIARVPSIFYGTKHEKSVREGRKLRQDFLAPGMESVHTLSDLYLVGQNLVKSLFVPGDDGMKREKVLCLISLVKAHPELLVFLSEIGATKAVLRILSQTSCPSLQGDCRLALALMGYTFPVKGNGVKILSLDGGGTRGVIVVEVLKAIERETGKATHELFDYIVGVSTGAILTTLLGPMRRNLDECEDLYMSLCKELFSDPGWWGTGRLFMSHSLYDTGVWEGLLKEHIGEISLAESAADPDCPKIGLVSAVVRKGLPVTYVFRNYVMPPGYQSRFAGNTGLKHTYRDAVRASSAAPGIFKEAVLSNEIHLDGGTNCNNPTAVAIHECQNLWPGKPIQAVLSIGNGLWDEFVMSDFTKRPVKVPTAKVEWASLWDKLSVFFNSATDTERVHITLRDLLPRDVYFRFNPYMSENIRLDECDPCKLEKLQEETVSYLRRNRRKLDRIVESLTDDNGQKMHVPAFSAKRFAYPPN